MSGINVDSALSWIIRLPLSNAGKLGALRSFGGLSVLEDTQFCWVRGDAINTDLSRRIRAIPDVEWFTIRPDAQLVRMDTTVPCARLPHGSWQALNEWLEVDLPETGFATAAAQKILLKLIRSSSPAAANVLQTGWSTWFAYAQTAPQVRLNRWAFARSMDDRVLIRGTPLPPIPGRRFVEAHGVIIPNGWRFEPNIGPRVAGQVLKLGESEMAIFSEDGSFERFDQCAFVHAARSAVRATNG